MKILKVFFWVLMVGALAGGVYLVRMNQETRKGATANQTVLSVLPDEITLDKDETVTAELWVDTGNATDKMVGGEFEVSFDRTKMEFVSAEVVMPYSLVNDSPDSGNGPLEFKVVSMTSTLNGGAFNLVKMKFKGLVDSGNGSLTPSGELVVEGLSEYWTVATINSSSYIIGDEVEGCVEGNKKCIDGKPAECVDGEWKVNSSCFPGLTCVNGVCENAMVCNVGEKKCISTTRKAVCTDNEWVESNCTGAGETCVNGSCISVGVTPPGDCTLGDKKCVNGIPTWCFEGEWKAMSACGSGKECQEGVCVIVEDQDDESLYLNFKTTMLGVRDDAKCAGGWKAKVAVKDSNGNAKEYSGVELVKSGTEEGMTVFRGSVKLTDWQVKTGLLVFIKGQKHMQMKYGEDGQEDIFNSLTGKLVVAEGGDSPEYNFKKYPLMPGDVNQDGKITGGDFSEVKTAAATHETFEEGTFKQNDLNGDCQYNSLDVLLLVKSLDVKQDEIY